MATEWLDWCHKHDLSGRRGNGPFGQFLGVVLHVNESEHGTPVSWFAADPPTNPDYVTPTFQVFKDGRVAQFLPLDWQPWCQIDGNYHYGAIETAGLHTEPLTDAQLHAIAKLISAYEDRFGVVLHVTDTAGQPGFGTHAMGGAAWGGHPCPGTIRAAQRHKILAIAHEGSTGVTTDKPDEATVAAVTEAVGKLLHEHLHDGVKVKGMLAADGNYHRLDTHLSRFRLGRFRPFVKHAKGKG